MILGGSIQSFISKNEVSLGFCNFFIRLDKFLSILIVLNFVKFFFLFLSLFETVNSLRREARGPQAAGEINCKRQMSLFSFLFLCCHGDTWFHLN